jgi:putative Ca2+/H+ antiporter (TMEM165/GDT1 family)
MSKQAFLGAAMLTAIGMVTSLGLYVGGAVRKDLRMQRWGLLAGGLFLAASGLLMWRLAQP